MINKAVGYSAFRTYGELPYPTRKQGKQLQQANKVWESTVRQVDHVKPLQNFNASKTNYKQSHVENTNPPDYHPEHVKKGGASTLSFNNTGTIKAYDRQQAQRYGKTNQITDPTNPKYDQRKFKPLQTGTEHWKTVYGQLCETSQSRYGPGGQGQGRSGKDSLQNFGNSGNNSNLNNTKGGTGSNFGRSQSVGGKSKHQIAQQNGRANSYKNKPYINNAKIGMTDYKFNYGQRIGAKPQDLMDRVSFKQPLRDHPLKRGTNQLWTEIPNYQGFKPSELQFKQYKDKIDRRNESNKGNLKLQVAENFLVQVPGYGGFKPQFQKTATNLRDSCLSTGNPI